MKPNRVVETHYTDLGRGGVVTVFAGTVGARFDLWDAHGDWPDLSPSRQHILKYSNVRNEFMRQHGIVLEHLTPNQWATLLSELMTTRSTEERVFH